MPSEDTGPACLLQAGFFFFTGKERLMNRLTPLFVSILIWLSGCQAVQPTPTAAKPAVWDGSLSAEIDPETAKSKVVLRVSFKR